MAIRIAVCDDNKEERLCLQQHAQRYFAEREYKIPYEIDVFSHPDELLNACEKKKYQLFLLDILMPMVNGIQAAKEIQTENPDAYFIFCTSSRDFPFDAYSVKALHYLTKPVQFVEFANAMDRFAARIDMEIKSDILITDDDGDITECQACKYLYIEANGKNCLLHMTDCKTIPIRSSLRGLSEKLASYPMIVKLGASYLVNMEMVRKVDGNAATLKTGEQLFIPGRHVTEFKRQFLGYYSEK